MDDHWLSIKQAARVSGRSESELRQAILEGDFCAIPVDDKREYLVRLRDASDVTVRSARRRTSRTESRGGPWGFVLLLLVVVIGPTAVFVIRYLL